MIENIAFLQLAGITNYITPSAGALGSFIKTFVWGFIFIAAITFAGFWVRNKLKYQYYSFIFKRRQEMGDMPQSIVIHGKAGYFKKRNGKTVFRTKYGIMPWMVVETTKMPDPNHMIGNTVFFQQIQKDNYVQAKLYVDWEMGNVRLFPVTDDLKHSAYLDMMDVQNVLNTSRLNNPMVIGMGIIGMIVVVTIIAFYFLSRGGF